MSVRRLVATMDIKGVVVRQFCDENGISRDWFYETRRRYQAEGEAGLEPKSRAPKHVANKTPAAVEDLIVTIRKDLDDDGLDAGPATIRWHLEQTDLDHVPSEATIWRILSARGFIVADPKKSHRPPRSFAAERANEVWQIDGTTWPLADGTEVKIINVVDDGSRVCVASVAHPSESREAIWAAFKAGAQVWGMPERFLSDNGKALRAMAKPLSELGIAAGHSRPYHPQTCGKVERFHQTEKKWLAKQPAAGSLAELQSQLDAFVQVYNSERPHRGIGRQIPAQRWNQMAKSGPADRALGATTRIGDRPVRANGTVAFANYRISLGSRYVGEVATVIVTGLNAAVFINNQLVRKLVIDPNKSTQAIYPTRGRPRTKP